MGGHVICCLRTSRRFEAHGFIPRQRPPVSSPDRTGQLTAALRLIWVSVLFGICSGAVSVITGLAGHSLSVLAAGLGVLADVTGSARR
jgi:predicted benzoate:H+ symporter BenE